MHAIKMLLPLLATLGSSSPASASTTSSVGRGDVSSNSSFNQTVSKVCQGSIQAVRIAVVTVSCEASELETATFCAVGGLAFNASAAEYNSTLYLDMTPTACGLSDESPSPTPTVNGDAYPPGVQVISSVSSSTTQISASNEPDDISNTSSSRAPNYMATPSIPFDSIQTVPEEGSDDNPFGTSSTGAGATRAPNTCLGVFVAVIGCVCLLA